MKKALQLAAVAIFGLLLQGNTLTPRSLNASATSAQTHQQAAKGGYDYTWYYDSDFFDPTGTEQTIVAELTRLRNLLPMYNFSAYPSIGFYPFEWGDHPTYVTAIIYSTYH